ncbi:uncharacterized protein [Manis javanica]|uniref:uncharacterized protein n=1 Tax=Manis javanica TaxID=9974 RepID=UPI003C6D023D
MQRRQRTRATLGSSARFPTRLPPQTQRAFQAPLPGCSAPRLRTDNNFPKNTKEKKGVHAEPHPGAEKQRSRARGSVCGASPSLRPGNNSAKAPAAQLAASSGSPTAASRCPLVPGAPGRRASSTRNVDRTPGARLPWPADPRRAPPGHARRHAARSPARPGEGLKSGENPLRPDQKTGRPRLGRPPRAGDGAAANRPGGRQRRQERRAGKRPRKRPDGSGRAERPRRSSGSGEVGRERSVPLGRPCSGRPGCRLPLTPPLPVPLRYSPLLHRRLVGFPRRHLRPSFCSSCDRPKVPATSCASPHRPWFTTPAALRHHDPQT